MNKNHPIKLILSLLALIFVLVAPVYAEEPNDNFLFSGLTAETTEITAPVSPRPTSKVAENITIINANQIARLNIHTLNELLNTIPGFQFDNIRTPGSNTYYSLQGATNRHIKILIDGISQNELIEGFAVPGFIPVQYIERLEIIKGAASTVWGSALGGVINVVTKHPDPEKAASGTTFASYGEHATSDLRGDLSGTVNRFGYYFSGGSLHSGGLLSNNRINQNNAYAKFAYSLPANGDITFGFSYLDSFKGLYDVPPPFDYHDTDKRQQYYSFFTFNYQIAEQLKLDLTASYRNMNFISQQGYMTSTDLWKEYRTKDTAGGGSAKLTWGDSRNSLATGLDFSRDSARISESIQADSQDNFERHYNRWSAHANATTSFGKLTILPGIRYDKTGLQKDHWSGTLGANYSLTEKNTLRAYAAKGYSLPLGTYNNPPQKVTTIQSGFETESVPYIWLKGTGFYNLLQDIESIDGTGTITDQVRQGVEIEFRTVPWYGFFLSGGYTYTDIREKITHETIPGLPVHTAKLALSYYHKPLNIDGVLTGNLSQWNKPEERLSKQAAIIWNLSLTKKFIGEFSPEIFFNGNNLFNGAQYLDEKYKNAPRSIEGGVRFSF